MQLRILVFVAVFLAFSLSAAFTQVTVFPYVENFDTFSMLPAQWSLEGFKDTTSGPRSKPNCILVKGNKTLCTLTSPPCNFTNVVPDKLTFWESRTKTAVSYRLRVYLSTDGINFDSLVAEFDTISSTSTYVERTVKLSNMGLEHQPFVRFRWQVFADSVNTTGVLRLDDFMISAISPNDVSLSNLSVFPSLPSREDPFSLSVVAKNLSTNALSASSVDFYLDANDDGAAESSERFATINTPVLASGDSAIITVQHAPMHAGQYCCIAVISLPLDGNHFNDTAQSIIVIRPKKGDILVNEIMYAPVDDEPEWVELMNASMDTINLKNWRISDSNISTKSIITQTNVFIPPRSYLVIAKDIVFATYHSGVTAIIANFSALNNSTPDAVVIYDTRLNTIDSVMYTPSWGGQNGKSLERIDTEMPSISMSNWGTSQDSIGSTPGRKNSVARLEYDVMISNLTQTRTLVAEKIVPGVNVNIRNIGRRIADSVFVSFYSDMNHNTIPEPSELIHTMLSSQSLNPGDSILLSESLPQLVSGVSNIIVIVDWWRDENSRNNRDSIFVKICFDPRSLIINEIMYDPLSDQNEWFELFNRSSQPIDLSRWTFNDKPTLSGVNSFEICNQPFVIRSGDYAIVAVDSSIFHLVQNTIHSDSIAHGIILNRSGGFGFNNDGDAVVLKDLTGQTIDSVAYLPSWHHPDVVDTRGRSLERINPNIDSNDPRNWSTCSNILGGTPGKANSIIVTSVKSNSMISIAPNPFSPDGDGFEDFCIIRYNLSMMTSTLNLRIYDVKGRLIRALANGEIAGTHGEIVWDGFDDNKQRARIGVYVVFLEATDQSCGKVVTAKAAAVVAAKL